MGTRTDDASPCTAAPRAAVENALDGRYEEAVGVPSPGVRWRAGIMARF